MIMIRCSDLGHRNHLMNNGRLSNTCRGNESFFLASDEM